MKYKCKCGRISYIQYNNFKHGGRCKGCQIDQSTGSNNPRYNHNLSPEEREKRKQKTRKTIIPT